MSQTEPNFKRTRLACFSAYFTMSSIFCVPPMLFVTFHQTYGISHTLLGTLVVINFFTQLGIDLIFTAFSKHFNPKKIVRIMPMITSLGLLLYALIPTCFPNIAYAGLALGTVIFSVAAGLSEVLLSPTIAAMPSDHPKRDMSTLHSLYAFGVVFAVLFSTAFLAIAGTKNWMYLIMVLALLPLISAFLFMRAPMPDMGTAEASVDKTSGNRHRTVGLLLCFACIFFGSCSENAMSTWISAYMETALGIEKAVGDILGVAMFAILLGLARILYAKYEKNICKVLLVSMIGAVVCYFTVGLSQHVVLSFFACILTGFCTSMLWPGTLIMMDEKIPNAGVAAFALMAAGGDLGASVSPQLIGIVVDSVSASAQGIELADRLGMTPEQLGLKAGMLISTLFPIIGTVAVIIAVRHFSKKERSA